MLKPAIVNAIPKMASSVNCVVIDKFDRALRMFSAFYMSEGGQDHAGARFAVRQRMILPKKTFL